MKKNPRHIPTGYNRRRAAQKRFRSTEFGRMFRTKLSRREMREIFLNGWVDYEYGGADSVSGTSVGSSDCGL
jgi:hypothetical protein